MLPVFREIRIENTNLCGHSCFFCPREKLTRPRGIMPVADFQLVLERVSASLPDFTGQVHLHGFGEPLLDRDLPEKIRRTREKWPNCWPWITSTLGVRVPESYLEALADAGLRLLKVSVYGRDRASYRKIHGVDLFDTAMANLEILRAAAARTGLSIDTKDAFADIEERIGEVRPTNRKRLLHNYGQGRTYNPPGLGPDRVCSIVAGHRREILVVTWDLNVVPCSFDFDATVVFGNLRETTLEAVFDSPAHHAFIAAHRAGLGGRHAVCANCDAGPFRPRNELAQ